MKNHDGQLHGVLDQTMNLVDGVVQSHRERLVPQEVGRVTFVGHGTVGVAGLPGVGSQELVRFPGDRFGMAFNLDPQEVGVILIDKSEGLSSGAEVHRTHRVLDVPVGEALLGRVIDGIGRPVDGLGPIHAAGRLPTERPAAAVMDQRVTRLLVSTLLPPQL